MGQAVHFRGIAAIMQAYEANCRGPWAIVSEKIVLCTSDDVENDDVEGGAAQLEEFLVRMKRGGTEGRCELRVYKLKEGEDIDITTKGYRGFKFTLFENEFQGQSNGANAVIEMLRKMEERLSAIEKAEEEEQEDEKPQTISEKIGAYALGLIENPAIQQAIAGAIVNGLGKFIPMQQGQAAKVAGVKQSDDVSDSVSEMQRSKIVKAINRLAVCDPQLGDHLLRLADIAENDPGKYQMALKFL